ncbi:hypothetical protein GS597_04820 [Synechococcales cyanobacterium C]|uniref:2TM domain-containing protein n=1 Tax=Petrachloros mirabilis ULC683 TaxID=2781853 RepID=A0A8K1ZXT0_9CYAN|nr:2TM domain-containing protein [Petrachloros mirabilis]NCJ05843.1 hypothetical protein [Petrachloros mirabilis ULC683]
MPPRWPRKPDRQDPAYRRLADRINFAVHVALFGALNSGFWFVRLLQAESWPWTVWLSGGWLSLLVLHGLYVFVIARYDQDSTPA